LMRTAHPDIDFTAVQVPGAVCTVCHRTGDLPVVRRGSLTVAEVAAGAETDRKERKE